MPVLAETINAAVQRGAYVAADAAGVPDGILLASGSELSLALNAKECLEKDFQVDVRVVSVPSMELFNEQPAAYREEVLPDAVRTRLAVEMANPQPLGQYVGLDGAVIGVDDFGMSGNGAAISAKYGFTVENVVDQFLTILRKG